MGKLVIHSDKISNKEEFIKICPFKAMETDGNTVTINSACKMCKICVKNSKNGEAEFVEDEIVQIDKSLWKGIMVYVDHVDGEIHPVTYELIGKAKELASKVGYPVYCLFMGYNIADKADDLLYYGIDKVFVYDNILLKNFRIEPYTAVFEDCVNTIKPSILLVGATTVGRQLAPRVAARFKTGLTADCTILDIEPNTDLVQIRPAFGGNIMAQIATPNNRPQMATVRYKVMDSATKSDTKNGEIVNCSIDNSKLVSGIEILNVVKKEKVQSIEAADVIVAVGRGIKTKEDLAMIQKLADILGAQLACTRPLVENGWVEPRRQIGLSGRTVRPKLITTCGISGAVQFCAGMNSAERIFAINTDEKAPIFKVAHYGIVGDIYEIVPMLISKISAYKEA